MPGVNLIKWLLHLAFLAPLISAQNDFGQFGNTNRDRNNNNGNNNFNSNFSPNFNPNFNPNNNNNINNNNNNNNFNDQFFAPRENQNRDFQSQNFTTPNFNPFNPNSGTNTQRRINFGGGNRGFGGGGFRDFSDSSVYSYPGLEERKCPQDWELYRQHCYRFVRSPIHNREGARLNCQAYGNGSTLLNLNSLEEHSWIVKRLSAIDPQKRKWYISTRQEGLGSWINEDGSQLINLDQAFLPDQPFTSQSVRNPFLAYSYSDRRNRWGLLKVQGNELFLYICEIPLSLVPLPLEERDFDYGLDIIDPKKIPRGPYFIKQPQNVVFDLSRNTIRPYTSLSCLAGGWPSPTYEWYKEEFRNGTLVAVRIDPLRQTKYTLSGGTMIIEDPGQQNDVGNYHCVAKNQFGAIISETVSLSFGYISEFILARSEEQAKQYWGKSIYCDAPQHYPGVFYLWSRSYFPNLVEEDQRVFVSYDGNLYISAVDMSDQGSYSCTVQSKTSSTGRNGPFFNLQVTPNANYQQLKFADYFPKVFPDSPKAKEEVRLECVAFGYPVPSYNWTRKGGDLPRGAVLRNYNRVLTIPKAEVEDQGEYICRATNSRLSIERSVTLSIQAAPTFTIELGNRHVDKESDLTWICEAFGIPDVSYQWYKNGEPLIVQQLENEDIGRYYVQDNVLTIKTVQPRDEGMYQCRANNSLAAKFSSGQLRVLYFRPSFKKRPVEPEIIAAEGGNATIACEPEAAPRLRPIWKKDGNLIGSGGRRIILPDGSLFIKPVSREDEGYFTCVSRNSMGEAESTGRLRLIRGPVLVEGLPDNRQYILGSSLKLHCRADADPGLDVAYTWNHNGIRLEPSYRVVFDTRIGYLDIINVTLADRGEYECEVVTRVGVLKSSTMVDIIGPPGAPGGVMSSDVNSTSVKIQWTDGAENGSPPFQYTIEGRTQWEPVWYTIIENQTAIVVDRDGRLSLSGENKRRQIEVVGRLSPWAVYEFRVLSANLYGYGPPSAPSPQTNTPPDVPFVYPRNIGGGGGKTGSLTITWDPLPPQEQNAPGIHYRIFWRRYKRENEDEYQTLVLSDWGNIGMYVVPVPSQYYYTLYDVRVQAINSMGEGPIPERPVQVYSAEDMPQVAPSLVIPKFFNSTAINVTWTPVEETREKMRGKLIGYRIRYWPKKDNIMYDPQALHYLSRTTRPWALIRGLQPNTYYYVQVMAYNAAGPGPASEAQFERTTKKAPQKPPTSVNVVAIDPSTIKVTWRYVAPSAEEEALSGYKVRIWEADQDLSTANDTFVPIGARKLEAIITGLQPEKTYNLRVLGYSIGGDGKMSSPAKEFVLALKSAGCLMDLSPMVRIVSILMVLWNITRYSSLPS